MQIVGQLPASASSCATSPAIPGTARTLEWSTSSPPPDYNFAFTPVVHDNDAWWDMKKRGYAASARRASSRSTCRRTPAPASSSPASPPCSASRLIWYIWWLAALSFVAMLAIAIGHTFNYNRDFDIPADEVVRDRGRAHPAARAEPSDMTRSLCNAAPQSAGRAGLLRRRRACASGRRQHHARLLDLPDERLPHLRDACSRPIGVLGAQLCRRARRRTTCSTCRWSRSTPRCCCCRRSPTASRCWRCSRARSAQTQVVAGGHRPVRRSPSSASSSTSSPT